MVIQRLSVRMGVNMLRISRKASPLNREPKNFSEFDETALFAWGFLGDDDSKTKHERIRGT